MDDITTAGTVTYLQELKPAKSGQNTILAGSVISPVFHFSPIKYQIPYGTANYGANLGDYVGGFVTESQPVNVLLNAVGLPDFLSLWTDYKIDYRNPEMVKAYLAQYPEIGDFIRNSWPALVSTFGELVEIILEVMVYPEETDYRTLVGWIQSTDDVYEGLEKFEQFQDEWFLDYITEIGDKFNFNIETK